MNFHVVLSQVGHSSVHLHVVTSFLYIYVFFAWQIRELHPQAATTLETARMYMAMARLQKPEVQYTPLSPACTAPPTTSCNNLTSSSTALALSSKSFGQCVRSFPPPFCVKNVSPPLCPLLYLLFRVLHSCCLFVFVVTMMYGRVVRMRLGSVLAVPVLLVLW